ncbi:MAG: branched-chain amino acid transaminase [Deltaproteobacteria bacterium]|nr:branched-chain amino acid transaminase [Deltaproteobacteria bacterium]
MIKGKRIWLNGEIVNWKDAKVHIVSDTFSYGYGVFEGIRCYRTKEGRAIFRLREHIDRLFGSARSLFLTIPYSPEDLVRGCREAVKVNDFEECYIRPMVYVSTYAESTWDFRGAAVDVAIAVWDWGEYIDKRAQSKGLRVKTASYARHHVNVHMTKSKANGNYVNFILARGEAQRAGFDEALMLDVNGCVAEGPVENVFMVKKGEIITPPLTYILEGITRDSILALAGEAGIRCREEFFTRDQLYNAEEVFFTGTAAEITPVSEIDHVPIGPGKPGPLTKKLTTLFFDVVHGEKQEYQAWLTPV